MLGANDYVAKPGGTGMRDAEAGRQAIREELIPKIKQFAAPVAGQPVVRVAPEGTPVATRRPTVRRRS